MRIELIDKRNQIVKSALSDSNGDTIFNINATDEILYMLANDGKQASILKFNNPLSTDGYDVDGLQESGSIKAFIYTDRGVYRPGDDIHLNVVVREDKKIRNHPINLRFVNPQGQVLIDDKILNPRRT